MDQGPAQLATTDLCDEFGEDLRVAEPLFEDYGGSKTFFGRIETIRAFEDNVLVRGALEEEGWGRVLVVDGGGSTRCALLGARLATMAHENGWAGVVVNGCVRDSVEVAKIPLGVRALHAVPRRSDKRGSGERGVSVEFAGVSFSPGEYLYADADGIVVAARDLLGGAG